MDDLSPDASELAREIFDLELALASRDLAALPGGPEGVLDDDFAEIGAGGRRWDRAATLEVLRTAAETKAGIDDFDVVLLAEDVVLASYLIRAEPPGRVSFRSSIWLRRGDRWRLRFHQGTTVAD